MALVVGKVCILEHRVAVYYAKLALGGELISKDPGRLCAVSWVAAKSKVSSPLLADAWWMCRRVLFLGVCIHKFVPCNTQ